MLQETLASHIRAAAKRYRVHPLLLFVAIDVLLHNEQATEGDIIVPFFKALSDEFRHIAEADISSKRKARKESGQLELSPVSNLPDIEKYIEAGDAEKVRSLVPDNEVVRFLHHRAYNHVRGNLLRMRRKWQQAGYRGEAPDAVQNIKLLCPDLIREYRQLIGMFKGFDLVMN